MNELLQMENGVVLLVALLVLLVAWLVYRRSRHGDRLGKVLNDIAFERIEGLVIPNADEGDDPGDSPGPLTLAQTHHGSE